MPPCRPCRVRLAPKRKSQKEEYSTLLGPAPAPAPAPAEKETASYLRLPSPSVLPRRRATLLFSLIQAPDPGSRGPPAEHRPSPLAIVNCRRSLARESCIFLSFGCLSGFPAPPVSCPGAIFPCVRRRYGGVFSWCGWVVIFRQLLFSPCARGAHLSCAR